jgi:hypothetical protein
MPNLKKLQQVGEITHSSGHIVPLMFNPNNPNKCAGGLGFSAEIGDHKIGAATAEEVTLMVREYLDQNSRLEWVPVIEVAEIRPFMGGVDERFIGLDIDRFYLAIGGQKVRILRWDEYENPRSSVGSIDQRRINDSSEYRYKSFVSDGFNLSEFPKVVGGHNHEVRSLIRYTDQTWATLERLQQGIEELRKRLIELVTTPAGVAALESPTMKLLGL